MKKKSLTQEILEAQVIHSGKKKIDLKELWREMDDIELDPRRALELQSKALPVS